MRRLLAIVALATLASCSDPLIENTVTGTWRGSSGAESFILVMQQSGTVVAGTGTMTSAAAGPRSLSISGNYQQPAFSGTLSPDGAQPITFVGTSEGRTLVGTLTGGGFSGEGLALTRD
jgi:hypothetical protein